MKIHRKIHGVATLCTLAGVIMSACGGSDEPATPNQPTIQVLSSDPGFVSGGDALIRISAASADQAKGMKVFLDGTDITSNLSYDAATSSLRGLVEGLKVGVNQLKATLADGGSASLSVRNFPRGGPIYSGPQIQPWDCRTVQQGLGEPTDAQCNAPAKYEYFYKSVSSGNFAPYSPSAPPAESDVAMTTTDQNETVKYIVRLETGAVNRATYQIAVLFDPTKPWSAFAAQSVWNHKLYVPTAGGFLKSYNQGILPTVTASPRQQDLVLNDMALKRGFLVAKTSFWVPLTNMEPVRAGESLMMLKERVTERYGSIRYTFTSGASGGSMTMSQIANNYPGLLQGIIPIAQFADYWGATDQEAHDCVLLGRYFSRTSPELWNDARDRVDVYGHVDEASCNFFISSFAALMVPQGGLPPLTDVGGANTYRPATNPGGARGTFQDYEVNYFGRRDPSSWTANETIIRRGFARDVKDNVGVQYGLQALLANKISADQFVDLNEKVGGVDIDFSPIPQRTVQDPGAAAVAYRAGLISDVKKLDQVAIISPRLPDVDPIATHSMVHSYIYLDRLKKAQGHSNNHVLWMLPGHDATVQHELSFAAMDRWLAAIEADKSIDSLSTKVVRNKPADLVEGCWAPGTTTSDQTLGNQVIDMAQCRAWYPVYGTPRIAATSNGTRHATFVTKCQLKPLNRADYSGVAFSDPQWGRLQAVFSDGVCDYSKPDAAQTPSISWLDYTDGPGGRPITVVLPAAF